MEGAPTKHELLQRLLDKGMVMVHIDARHEGVDVPDLYRKDGDLRLNLSYRFQAGDLRVSDDHVSATLSFSGRPYTCQLPLPSIFAIVSHITGETFFFPGDAPSEALTELADMVRRGQEEDAAEGETGADSEPVGVTSLEPPRRPALHAIEGGSGQNEGEDEGEGDQEGEPVEARPSRPHLRLVK